MNKLKKRVLIFDLDGVLIDSKKNMSFSWRKVQQIHSLENTDFKNYFENIGMPFFDILKKIGIKKNLQKIHDTYQKESIKKANLISYYKNILNTIRILKKRKYSLCIVTSKDKKRTKFFLGKNIKHFSYIESNNTKNKGKPNPYSIIRIIKKLKVEKSDCVYIGDTNVDYQTAKNSKIDFIFAQWGYGRNLNYKNKCKKPFHLLKILS